MRKILILASVVLVALGAAAQIRTDTYSEASVRVSVIALQPQPDGGCAARFCGEAPSVDGRSVLRACTELVELTSTRSRCLDLVTAGEDQVSVALKISADGGQP